MVVLKFSLHPEKQAINQMLGHENLKYVNLWLQQECFEHAHSLFTHLLIAHEPGALVTIFGFDASSLLRN